MSSLYQAAVDADNLFQAELLRVYGTERKAAEARYYAIHEDAGVICAKAAKVAVDIAWLHPDALACKGGR